MNMDARIFKAYDIRGTYPDQLDEEAVYKIAQGFVHILKAKKVVIGHDMRNSAEMLYPQVRQGLIDMGVEVIDIGLCSTPMSYFANYYYKADGSMMLTASHNPSGYNGFKLCGRDAQPFVNFAPPSKIEEVILKGKITPALRKGSARSENILFPYLEKICQGLNLTGKLGKIVIDAGNGISGMVIPKLMEKLKLEYIPLFFELDGSFPNHEPNPLEQETLVTLQKKVVSEKAILGVSIDGDGDRIGFVDENGEDINGDMITVLIALAMLKEKPKLKVMYDLRSSWAVKEEITKAGGKAEMCVIGHGLIKPKMRKEKVDFAGELSDHYYFKDLNYTDSAEMALVFVLKLLSESGQSISEMIKPLKRYFATGEINFKVDNLAAKIAEIETKFPDGKHIHLDGVSIEFNDWWFNLRASNTEPLLRLNLEAKTKELMEEKKQLLCKLVGVSPEE